jgi:hypothetical protein
MKTYLFSDADVFQFSIEARSHRAALLKARHIFGIHAPLRRIGYAGNYVAYRSAATHYKCLIVEV